MTPIPTAGSSRNAGHHGVSCAGTDTRVPVAGATLPTATGDIKREGVTETRRIDLGDGHFAVVDADQDGIDGYRWNCFHMDRATKTGITVRRYAAAHQPGNQSPRTKILLHRLITQAAAGTEVDHINGDGLDNRKANLRVVTRAQNAQNRVAAQANSKTGVLGVCWIESRRRFSAEVKVGGKRVLLQRFKTLEEASAAVAEARRRFQPYSAENTQEARPRG